MNSTIRQTIAEVFAWILANVLCVVAASGAVYLIGDMLDWGKAHRAFYTTAIAIASLTWGSWAALIWTRNRGLRVWQRLSTATPGVITLVVGGFGAYVGVGALISWIVVMLAGIGMIAAALILARAIGASAAPNFRVGLGIGLGVFPVMVLGLSLLAGMMWYQFVTDMFTTDWRSLISFATVINSILAMALTSTVIPAVTSSFCQRVSQNLR